MPVRVNLNKLDQDDESRRKEYKELRSLQLEEYPRISTKMAYDIVEGIEEDISEGLGYAGTVQELEEFLTDEETVEARELIAESMMLACEIMEFEPWFEELDRYNGEHEQWDCNDKENKNTIDTVTLSAISGVWDVGVRGRFLSNKLRPFKDKVNERFAKSEEEGEDGD